MFKILALSLTLLLPPFAPQRIHALLHLCFLGIVSCIPKLRISRFFGHKFLTDKVARIIVGIFVATAVTHLRRCSGTGMFPVCSTYCSAVLIAIYAELLLGEVAR